MGKKEEAREKAQAKLEKAQRRLAELEEEYNAARVKGKKEVRAAQEKAERRLAKAQARIEEQQRIVDKRQRRLGEVPAAQGDAAPVPVSTDESVEQADDGGSGSDDQPTADVTSPEAAADVIEARMSDGITEGSVPILDTADSGSSDGSHPETGVEVSSILRANPDVSPTEPG